MWWPAPPRIVLNTPPELTALTTAFEAWYTKQKPFARITWVHSQGNVAVKANFASGSYEFSVVPLQAAALLLFNESGGPLTLEAIRNKLGLSVEHAKRTMHSLACGKTKALKKTPEGQTIADDHTFDFNAAFADKIRKLRIPMASLEETHNAKKTDEERVHTVEAAIVRIMKARHTLSHQELSAAVMEQVRSARLSVFRRAPLLTLLTLLAHPLPRPPPLLPVSCRQLQFFQPRPAMIKKRIEDLIERVRRRHARQCAQSAHSHAHQPPARHPPSAAPE